MSPVSAIIPGPFDPRTGARSMTAQPKRTLLVTSALPYANGAPHLGHMVEYVQTDIWVRFQRLRGHDVLFIWANDAHGTPIMLKARQEGITPEALIARVGVEQKRDFDDFDISLRQLPHDALGREPRDHVRNLPAAAAAGHIRRETIVQAYDEQAGMFLPDRYVRGTCPNCGAPDQYGDSCEVCGATYTPADLIDAGVGRERHGAGAARVRAPVLQARRLRADAARVDRRRAPAAGRHAPSSASGSAPGCATGTSRATRRTSASRSRASRTSTSTSGSTRRSATSPACCSTAGARGRDFDRYWAPDSDAEVYHFIGKDIVYFHTLFWPAVLQRRGLSHADRRARARLPDRQRPEDVEVARHADQRARRSSSTCRPNTCATTSPRASATASRTSTSASTTSSPR